MIDNTCANISTGAGASACANIGAGACAIIGAGACANIGAGAGANIGAGARAIVANVVDVGGADAVLIHRVIYMIDLSTCQPSKFCYFDLPDSLKWPWMLVSYLFFIIHFLMCELFFCPMFFRIFSLYTPITGSYVE